MTDGYKRKTMSAAVQFSIESHWLTETTHKTRLFKHELQNSWLLVAGTMIKLFDPTLTVLLYFVVHFVSESN